MHKDWLPQALMGFLHRHEREEHGHATQFYYFHTDAMGTPKLATNEKQQVVWRWNEDAFGATVAAEQDRHGHRDHDRDHGKSHDIEVNLRYPGQYYDAETGLFYNWNRYYNPRTGRYSRSDPIGLSGGVNSYLYVLANPFEYADFMGWFRMYGYENRGAGYGWQMQYEIQFDPVGKQVGEYAAKNVIKRAVGSWGNIVGKLIQGIDVEPVGPYSPVKNKIQCAELDSELAEDYRDMFGDKARLTRDETKRFLDAIWNKYPQMKGLYPPPQDMMDSAGANARNNWFYRLSQ